MKKKYKKEIENFILIVVSEAVAVEIENNYPSFKEYSGYIEIYNLINQIHKELINSEVLKQYYKSKNKRDFFIDNYNTNFDFYFSDEAIAITKIELKGYEKNN